MAKIFIATLVFLLALTGCNDNSKHTMTNNDKQKMIDSLILTYQKTGFAITRQQAEKFVDDFEKARKENGDSAIYFDGINLGLSEPTTDTAELRRINEKNKRY